MEHKILLAANICDSQGVAHTKGIYYRANHSPELFLGSRGEILLSQKGTFTSSQFSKINLNWLATYHTICRGYSKGGRRQREKSIQTPFRKGSRDFKFEVKGKGKHGSHQAIQDYVFPEPKWITLLSISTTYLH